MVLAVGVAVAVWRWVGVRAACPFSDVVEVDGVAEVVVLKIRQCALQAARPFSFLAIAVSMVADL